MGVVKCRAPQQLAILAHQVPYTDILPLCGHRVLVQLGLSPTTSLSRLAEQGKQVRLEVVQPGVMASRHPLLHTRESEGTLCWGPEVGRKEGGKEGRGERGKEGSERKRGRRERGEREGGMYTSINSETSRII